MIMWRGGCDEIVFGSCHQLNCIAAHACRATLDEKGLSCTPGSSDDLLSRSSIPTAWPTTRPPTLNRVTPGPIATASQAKSRPIMKEYLIYDKNITDVLIDPVEGVDCDRSGLNHDLDSAGVSILRFANFQTHLFRRNVSHFVRNHANRNSNK